MNKAIKYIFCFIACLYAGIAAAEDFAVQKTKHTSLSLYRGQNNQFIAEFTIEPKWHIYWINPGDVGLPTKIYADDNELVPSAISVPKHQILFGSMHEIFHENHAYYRFTLPSADISVLSFEFAECHKTCRQQKLTFRPQDIAVSPPALWQEITRRADARMPQKLNIDGEITPERIVINKSFAELPLLLPYDSEVMTADSLVITSDNNRTVLNWSNQSGKTINRALLISEDGVFDIDFAAVLDFNTLLYTILLAFLGGIILNAMPCVFPILSLKIFSLLETPANPRQAKYAALNYTLGVVCSFMLLTGCLVWLKRKGEALGWGFQLQSPWFTGTMAVIFFLLFLCVCDKIKFPDFANRLIHRLSALNHFTTGFFAVLIASPCTGPFMGVAVGYAFTRSPAEIYAVFLSLALGYALPYAIIEMFPQKIQQIFPRPGVWMQRLKIALSIPILLTSLWLFSVLYKQLAPTDAFAETSQLNWLSYDTAAVDKLNEQKENVFINFTADWCLTCQFNKKFILDSERFRNFVRQNNVHLFIADLTEENEEYSRALSAYGRDSIPLYVYYHGGNYRILPLFFGISSLENNSD